MSPDMLTLVADVLAYDLALDTWDLWSSMVEAEEVPLAICRRCSLAALGVVSRKEISWTRLENDMIPIVKGGFAVGARKQILKVDGTDARTGLMRRQSHLRHE